jgi:MFS family permease
VGGFITTYYHWRGIFWLNVPIGLLGLALALWWVPQVRAEHQKPMDWPGFVLTGGGLALAIFGFTLLGSRSGGLGTALLMMGAGLGLLAVYVWHARRTPHPIIDLTLLHIDSFRIALVGGLLFRVAVGAMPFLLPLMLQVGFGMSAFASGTLTFTGAVGAVTMKLTAAPILKRWGFKRVLCGNAWISSGLVAALALFTVHTPAAVIMTVLLVGGFFRSLQFTSLNTLGYAEVEQDALSRATSLVGVVQQLSLAAGVAIAAMLLDGSRSLEGRTDLLAMDFRRAFVAVGVISLASLFWYRKLAPDAGAEMSGHRADSEASAAA